MSSATQTSPDPTPFRPEILAPAGNLFKLRAAVRHGADAVYLAGKKFGLRHAADNFSDKEIETACCFAHAHNCKVYVVLNGFLFDSDLAQLPPFLEQLSQAGVDAVIASDLGVVHTIRRHSNLAIHLSTQASALNTYAALFWKKQGVKRIVLGRETTVFEAGRIKREAEIEVEIFVHGAMCMAYSGNCVISNYTAGRDSNRGGCIQSCRFKYTQADKPQVEALADDHILSSKDLAAIDAMPQILEQEIDSLKIEGRMKSALYVASAAGAYSQARDTLLANRALDLQSLKQNRDAVSHRDYTMANTLHKAGPDSVFLGADTVKPGTHRMLGHVVEASVQDKMAVHLKNPISKGEPIEVLTQDGQWVTFAADPIINLSGEPIDIAQPNRVVLLPAQNGAVAESLLRKNLNAAVRA